MGMHRRVLYLGFEIHDNSLDNFFELTRGAPEKKKEHQHERTHGESYCQRQRLTPTTKLWGGQERLDTSSTHCIKNNAPPKKKKTYTVCYY